MSFDMFSTLSLPYIRIIVTLSIFSNGKTLSYDYRVVDYSDEYSDIDNRGERGYDLDHEFKYYSNDIHERAKQSRAQTNKDIFNDLVDSKLSINDVTARLPLRPLKRVEPDGYCDTKRCQACLETCRYLRNVDHLKKQLTLYLYLRLCSEGCKLNIMCLVDNICLPVFEDSPAQFIECANKCNLFQVMPEIFRTSLCDPSY